MSDQLNTDLENTLTAILKLARIQIKDIDSVTINTCVALLKGVYAQGVTFGTSCGEVN